jgi:hypothetical protein
MREVRPLCSTGITPLPRYYEPVRLPAAAGALLWISAHRWSGHADHPAGSPRTLDSSVVARPPQSPRAARWVRLLVASPSVAGFVTSARVAAAIGLTRPNRVRVRWARDFARHDRFVVRPAASPGRTGPFRAFGCPPTPDRSYMVNEQFTWLTPRSQQEESGLPWRDRSNKATKKQQRRNKPFVSVASILGPGGTEGTDRGDGGNGFTVE